MNIETLYTLFKASSGITTDTRNIQKGNIFFALKGDSFNGNHFAVDAIKAGASYAIVDEEINAGEDYHNSIVVVENVLEIMQELALYHRNKIGCKVIALTGSNGKTTTKELMAAVLQKKFKTHYTKGNFNNHVGIPITLLAMSEDTEIAVIEMGANHQKEIEGYCAYVNPDFGLITNVGKAHLEGFGGEEGVLKGKTELFKFLGSKGGLLFVNDSHAKLLGKALEYSSLEKIIYYGTNPSSFVSGEISGDGDLLSFIFNDKTIINTNLVGDYNFENALAAVCIGKYFGVSSSDIKAALEEYVPTNNRSQKIVSGTNTIILDAYNANPSSMEEALRNFDSIKADKKMTIIGQMMELGDFSQEEHKRIAQQVLDMNLWKRVFVGKGFEFLKTDNDTLFFESTIALKEWYKKEVFEHTTQLIKGSRSNGLEVLLK